MSSSRLQPLTVLWVAPDGRQLGDERLQDADPTMAACVAGSNADALDLIRARESGGEAIDAVICVHRPPQLDAVEFVTALRAERSDLPVLVVPSSTDCECTDAVLAAGATDVVQATVDSLSPAVLANRIRQFTGMDVDDRPGTDSSTASATNDADDPDEPDDADEGTEVDHVGRLTEGVKRIRSVDDADTVVRTLAETAEALLDAPGVGVFRFDDDENLLVPAAITDRMDEFYGGETVFGPGKPDSITWQVFAAGESVLFDDVRTAGINVNEATAARSSVFVPIGEHGVLAASTDARGAYSERSREALELLAAAASAAFDRLADAAARRAQADRIRKLEGRRARADHTTDLLRSVSRAVAAAGTREEVETAVLDSLVDDDRFAFAWIGTVDSVDGDLTPHQWRGRGNQYLDEVALAAGHGDEPACRTAREWQPTVEQNVADDIEHDWQHEALTRDFHAVASVPLQYDGVDYGVLTVYADRPDAFDEPVASLLAEVGELTAVALSAIERKFSALAQSVTEVDVRIDDADGVLTVIAGRLGATVECRELVPMPDGSTKVRFAVAGVSAEAVLSATAGLVAVDAVTHLGGGQDHQFSAVVGGETVGSLIASAGGVPDEIVVDERTVEATAHLPRAIDTETFRSRLERWYPGTKIVARRERDQFAMARAGYARDVESTLTERQLDVLRTAHESGFFRSPREATGQDVADRLGVSQPTVSHHLRAAQGTLFDVLFGTE